MIWYLFRLSVKKTSQRKPAKWGVGVSKDMALPKTVQIGIWGEKSKEEVRLK